MDEKKAKDGHVVEQHGPAAYLISVIKKVKPQLIKKVEASETEQVQQDPEKEIMQLIAENPSMNVPTFFNLLKTQGYIFTKKKIEADSGSANIAALRKEADGKIKFTSNRFMEREAIPASGSLGASPESDIVGFTKFKVILIQEGMGNMRDAYFYSRQALESAIPAFEGKKIYSDHPSASDEYNRPERSVRDILGHFENVHLEEGEAGQAQLVADCIISPEEPFRWARSLMVHAVEYSKKYPDKDFIGLSINANGDAQEISIDKLIESGVPESALPKLQKAKENGIENVKLVSVISDAVSCDLVTEAGAGGRVLQLLEGEKSMDDKKDLKKDAMKDPAGPDQAAAAAEAGEEQQPHADEQQDIELIKKMIAKYMGDDAAPTEEECGVTKEALDACKEMGMEGEEAEKSAVAHLKMAKHLAAKKEAKAKESEEKAKEAEGKKVEEAEEKTQESEEKHKESMLKLTAENAKLKESLRAIELADHLDKVCKKSGLRNSVTDSFKKCLGTPKSIDHINAQWKIFEAGYHTKAEGSSVIDSLFINPEKAQAPKANLFDGIFK